ncbi:MAG: hypothetical protein BAA02_08065 [Paenibacillaceae bacterium ZCTH02-B3]|nr:MAG: hypothetical protein BAA02_08065 [Paenibacillaceae bacterium ZCTH02-B3]
MKAERRPFASVVQAVLIMLLVVSFILISQRFSEGLYRFGFVLLIATTFVQIAFGNIPPSAGFGQSMKLLGITFGVIAVIFAVGIWIAPYLVKLGQG